MPHPVKPVPDDLHGATPYLSIGGAAAAIEFYERAFGATEIYRIDMGGGLIGHAEIRIGKALIMLADEFPDMGFNGPRKLGGSPVVLHLYVENVDAFSMRAIDAGAKVRKPVGDQFWGDRSCQLEDPFGHVWNFCTRIEDVTPEEIKRRAAKMFGGG